VGTKNGRLLSLMVRILVRPVLTVVIMLSLAPLAGCSGAVGDPYGQVNEHIADANEAIEEHNQRFEEARSAYEEAKESVESGEDTAQEEERMAQARENMQKARDTLGEARGQLSEVQDLEVEAEVKEYAEILSEAIDAQLAGEGGEIGFYELLERDPTLEDNRERAEEILTEVDDRYEEARNAYDRARELADANPDLLPEG
jgi:tetratricopeptide (TPR) repeat protein